MPLTISQDLLKLGPEQFATTCTVAGTVFLALSAAPLAAPRPVGRMWRRFPRSVWPGRILSVVALAWAALWLLAMPLGPFAVIREPMPILLVVAIAAVWYLCEELLSCRAIGGILVLVPTLLLSAAQWHGSAWRLVPLVVGYLFAVAGMFFIAKPYLLRDALFFLAESPVRTRLAGALSAVVGALFLVAAYA